MSAKYKSPSFLLPNELNTSANPANDTGVNSLYSMDFDSSSSDYINTDLSININSFSVSCWFKGDNLHTGGQKRLFDFADSTRTANKFPVLFTGSSAYGSIGVGKIAVFDFTTSQSISATWDTNRNGLWNHVVLLVNNTNVELYLNGSSLVSGTITRDTYQDMTKFVIGTSSNYSSTQHFNGQIDEVAIFNRALNTTEISALYDGSGSNIRPSNLMATDLNPIAYYPLGEQAQMQGYLGNEASSEWQFPNGVLQDYVMDFDGTDYIDISESNNSLGSLTSGTLSFWIKPATISGTQTIFGYGNTTTTNDFFSLSTFTGGKLRLLFRNDSSGTAWPNNGCDLRTSGVVSVNKWYNVCLVSNGSSYTLYLNGSQITLGVDAGSNSGKWFGDFVGATMDRILIGAKQSTSIGSYFDGEISNVVLWRSDQSSNIANIYNNGSPQTTYTVTPQNWWKLNADSVYTPSAPNYTTALYFDGTDEIQIPSFSLSSEFSIGVWLNADTFAAGSSLIFGYNANNSEKIEFNGSSSILIKNATANITYSGTSWNLNEWQHLLITRDSSNNLKIYRNGEYWGGNSHSGTFIFDRISGFNNSARHFNGRLSNIAIFNSELSSTQVSTLFNFGTPETNISFSPTAWWKLDNTTTGIQDSSGNGNNGTNNGATDISSGVAVTPSWKIPSALPIPTINYTTALNFVDTPGDKIEITSPSSSMQPTTTLTLSFWANFKQDANWMLSNGGWGQSSSAYSGYSVQTYNGRSLRFWIGNGTASGSFTTGASVFNLNQWHHILITYDSGTAILYIDGNVVSWSGTGGINSIAYSASYNPFFGSVNSGGASFNAYEGLLSNAAIFNSALSASQVLSLYNDGQPESSISFSPVSWWKLDSTTITDSAGSNNGTNNGATQVTSDVYAETIPVNGVSTTLPSTALQQSDLQFDSPYSNYSLSFDGTGYIDCGDSDIFSFGNGSSDNPFSISAWINITATTSQGIVTKYGSSTSLREWLFYTTGGKIRLLLWSGSTNNIATSSTVLSTNTWYHVLATYDGRGGSTAYDGINIYVNGVLESVTKNGGSYTAMSNTSQPVQIATHSGGSFLDGKIDETSIFNYSLSEAQVLEIYNNGRPKDLSTFSGTAPISWWRLGENAYFQDSTLVLPNSIIGAPNGEAATNNLEMISADAPGTYANGVGENLDILDRVGDAPLSTSNSQSYNMIPDDKVTLCTFICRFAN